MVYEQLAAAIRGRRVVRFQYDGFERVVIPSAPGRTRTGRAAVRGYQTSGARGRGSLPAWKLFSLASVSRLVVTDDVFVVPQQYRRDDAALVSITAQL